ncbi:MAG: protein-glutamate O-methyltransferase CheR, partial [Clostridiaceae bacterium]|nr:protein-glutamate O-methyltransferase CheR [Clostridiaceae bacterium]
MKNQGSQLKQELKEEVKELQSDSKENLENIEVELLLDAILKRYGYDFRNYSAASRKRRIKNFLTNTKYSKISELIVQLLYDTTFLEKFIYNLSVTVTEMFRDPLVYKTVRKIVIPLLKTYPFVKIWHAGCASGEEVYSMAILLKEEGLYDKCQIYATDMNDSILEKAKEGIYSIKSLKEYTYNYQKAGGKRPFSEFYYSKYDSIIINRELKKNITFANHNLVTDSTFGEMHFIICRNVLIYFNNILQDRVLKLFNDSLISNGFLCLGAKESLNFSTISENFQKLA